MGGVEGSGGVLTAEDDDECNLMVGSNRKQPHMGPEPGQISDKLQNRSPHIAPRPHMRPTPLTGGRRGRVGKTGGCVYIRTAAATINGVIYRIDAPNHHTTLSHTTFSKFGILQQKCAG